MKTTLHKLQAYRLPVKEWEKLLRYLNKREADHDELSVLTILQAVGLYGALYSLRTVPGFEKEKRLYLIWCARQVESNMKDIRSRRFLNVAEDYAHGDTTRNKRDAAGDAAWSAVLRASWNLANQPKGSYAYAASWIESAAAKAAAWAGQGSIKAAAWAAAASDSPDTWKENTSGPLQARQAQEEELYRLLLRMKNENIIELP